MAQGQAISVMVRAAEMTGEQRFWDAAYRALTPFTKLTYEGGVKNMFMGQYVWYEEYPFIDGLFVLNGFMYSLIGLYDLASAENVPSYAKIQAQQLFDDGIRSLKVRLYFYSEVHYVFRLCYHSLITERGQTTTCNILSNKSHRIEHDGIIIQFIYSNSMSLSRFFTTKYLKNFLHVGRDI